MIIDAPKNTCQLKGLLIFIYFGQVTADFNDDK